MTLNKSLHILLSRYHKTLFQKHNGLACSALFFISSCFLYVYKAYYYECSVKCLWIAVTECPLCPLLPPPPPILRLGPHTLIWRRFHQVAFQLLQPVVSLCIKCPIWSAYNANITGSLSSLDSSFFIFYSKHAQTFIDEFNLTVQVISCMYCTLT